MTMTGDPLHILRTNLDRLMVLRGAVSPKGEPSQKKLAERAGVDAKTVNAIFHPGGNPRLKTLDKLSVELGAAVWQLMLPGLVLDDDINRALRAGAPADVWALAAALAAAPADVREKVVDYARYLIGQTTDSQAKSLIKKAAAPAG